DRGEAEARGHGEGGLVEPRDEGGGIGGRILLDEEVAEGEGRGAGGGEGRGRGERDARREPAREAGHGCARRAGEAGEVGECERERDPAAGRGAEPAEEGAAHG